MNKDNKIKNETRVEKSTPILQVETSLLWRPMEQL
jgi:hypothetical protein